ncbi:3-oxoacyl-[acyl-carrier-protein] reductase [Mycobacterium avium subsp. hominissuis]
MCEPGSLNGIPAFVTGGSRGIGAAIAQHLAAAGAAVAIGYRNRAAQAEQVAASITTAGGRAICVAGDVSDEDEVDQAFARIEAELGPVGILVNNAGAHRGGRVQKLALDDWRLVHNASLTSAFLCARRAVPLMIERRWGRIINVTSVVGLNGFPGDAAYASAKAGLIGLTKALALELARDQITVTAVAPGFVDTEMTRGLARSVRERIERTIPAHRQATADEIAQTVGFLAAGPDYITGTVIVVDGGWRIA